MAVTEAEVGEAIANGATTREAVTRACRAGGDCGACHGMIENMIEDHLEAACPAPCESGTDVTQSPPLVSAQALVRVRAA